MGVITYRKAERDDVTILAKMRISQLQDEGEKPTFDLTPDLLAYYDRHMNAGTFVAWLAIADGQIIATSGMSFTEKPPYYNNPSGKIGLLNSVYTSPEYRRQGIGKVLLGKVVEEARQYGCATVQLTASDMGILLYENFGFQRYEKFMQYRL